MPCCKRHIDRRGQAGWQRGRDTICAAVGDNDTFALTLVKVGPFLPYVEVDVYEYRADSLPAVGDTITVSRIDATAGETRAYVTRVDGNATPPLIASEVEAAGRPTF
jgi:hypothetical protein